MAQAASAKTPDMADKTGDDPQRRTLQPQRSRDQGDSGRAAGPESVTSMLVT